jgi:predicted nucleotidyltransferase
MMVAARLTPYPELDEVLHGHVERLQETLGDLLVGVYLLGSLAIGDFDATSDIDFVVVTAGEMSDSQVEQVQVVHNQTYGQDNRWVKHFEYSFFPLDTLKLPSSPFSSHGRVQDNERELWYFDHGGREIERSDHDNSLVTRWTLREKGVAVIGAEPPSFLDPVSPAALRKEIQDSLVGWGNELLEDPEPYRNRFFQAFIVLHFCRMLQDLHEGRITSKRAGAEWAKSNLDPTWISLIEYCWNDRQDSEIHVSQPAVPEIFQEVLAFVAYAVALGTKINIKSL